MKTPFFDWIQISFEICMILFIFFLVFIAMYWIMKRIRSKFNVQEDRIATKADVKELDNAFNDLDNDYWSLEKRVSYLEWTLMAQKEKDETMYLSDMTQAKRGPGRPKKQEE